MIGYAFGTYNTTNRTDIENCKTELTAVQPKVADLEKRTTETATALVALQKSVDDFKKDNKDDHKDIKADVKEIRRILEERAKVADRP